MKFLYVSTAIIISIICFLGMFHIVSSSYATTIIPKLSFTFSDTFVSIDEVINRYNNKNLSEKLRGDPQFDNIIRVLRSKELISDVSKKEKESTKKEPSTSASNKAYEQTDYVDIKSAVLDGQSAVDKSIRFFAEFKKIELYEGNPALDVRAETETGSSIWSVTFDDSYKNVVSGFTQGQRLHIICTIIRMGSVASACQLTKFL